MNFKSNAKINFILHIFLKYLEIFKLKISEVHAQIRIRNRGNGNFLVSNYEGNLSTLEGVYGVEFQTWIATSASDAGGNMVIKSHFTERCLDSDIDGNAFTKMCTGSSSQLWRTDDYSHLINVATYRCLGSNGSGIIKYFTSKANF